MAMTAKEWSVNALATEFAMDRRTVARRLSSVPPCGEKAGAPTWALRDAAPALIGSAGKRAPRPAGPAPAPPPGFEFVQNLDPVDAAAAVLMLSLVYTSPPTIAALTVAAGAPVRVAYAATTALQVAMLDSVAELAREAEVEPWHSEEDPAVAAPEVFAEVNWQNLAEMAGEPVDIDGWRAWAAERFGDDAAAA